MQSTTHVDAVGMEMYATGPEILPGSGSPRSADLSTAMSTLASTYGVKTGLTQINVPFYDTVNPSAGYLDQQKSVYDYMIKACVVPASNCFMFMTWGVSDSVLTVPGSVKVINTPDGKPHYAFGGTLFDPEYQPRPAFSAVLAALQ